MGHKRSFFVGQVRSGQPPLGLENAKFLSFFRSRSKKILSGQVKKYQSQIRVGLLFTAGQVYAWVSSGLISTLEDLFQSDISWKGSQGGNMASSQNSILANRIHLLAG